MQPRPLKSQPQFQPRTASQNSFVPPRHELVILQPVYDFLWTIKWKGRLFDNLKAAIFLFFYLLLIHSNTFHFLSDKDPKVLWNVAVFFKCPHQKGLPIFVLWDLTQDLPFAFSGSLKAKLEQTYPSNFHVKTAVVFKLFLNFYHKS